MRCGSKRCGELGTSALDRGEADEIDSSDLEAYVEELTPRKAKRSGAKSSTGMRKPTR